MLTPFLISSRFPLDWTRSISPDAGKLPYELLLGRNLIDGSSQSPDGNFAEISTFPYLNAKEFKVRIRALLMGFKMLAWLPTRRQPELAASVHLFQRDSKRFKEIKKAFRQIQYHCEFHLTARWRPHANLGRPCEEKSPRNRRQSMSVECSNFHLRRTSCFGCLCTIEIPPSVKNATNTFTTFFKSFSNIPRRHWKSYHVSTRPGRSYRTNPRKWDPLRTASCRPMIF